LLIKPFVWWRSRCRCRRGLLKLPKEQDSGRQVILSISPALKTIVSPYILVNYTPNVFLLRFVHVPATQHNSCFTTYVSVIFVIFFLSGAFLIPYASFLVLGGVPLFFMELSIGQILQAGPITAWTKLSRLFSGRNFNEKKLEDEIDELPRKISIYISFSLTSSSVLIFVSFPFLSSHFLPSCVFTFMLSFDSFFSVSQRNPLRIQEMTK